MTDEPMKYEEAIRLVNLLSHGGVNWEDDHPRCTHCGEWMTEGLEDGERMSPAAWRFCDKKMLTYPQPIEEDELELEPKISVSGHRVEATGDEAYELHEQEKQEARLIEPGEPIVTASGKRLTEEDIEDYVAEAEEGYDPEELKKRNPRKRREL